MSTQESPNVENWMKIWDGQITKNPSSENVLQMLIELDGYSNGATTKFSNEDWIKKFEGIKEKLEIKDGESIYEVGCGAGASLYPFKDTNKIGGLDFSAELIKVAKEYVGEDFVADEAINLHKYFTKDGLIDRTVDHMISNGVFLYFPTLDYAESVLVQMTEVTGKTILISDINDAEFEEESMEARYAAYGGKVKYEKDYEGLKQLFIPKSFFEKFAEKYNYFIDFYEDEVEEGTNSTKRYNVILS